MSIIAAQGDALPCWQPVENAPQRDRDRAAILDRLALKVA
jgi:hypothetical protein